MIRKSVLVLGMVIGYLANTGFLIQDQPVEPANGWRGLLVALLLIIIIAILMIWQGLQTPAAAARYHLDHAEHGHAEEHELAPVESAARSAENPLEVLPAVEPESLAEPAAPVELGEPDDLTKIEGIGPKINEILHQAGIRHFADLAKADPGQIKEILKQAGPRFALADPGTWPEQAGYLAVGDLEKFQALTESLRGGRAAT